MHYKFTVIRDIYYCRYCHLSFNLIDEHLDFFDTHNVTKGMAEEIAYSAQGCLSFEKGSENIKRYLNVDVSESSTRTISEKIGKIVYDKDLENSKRTYEKPEESIPTLHEKDKKKGILYNYADGSMVNTVEKDKNGSTWREIKLGLVYYDRNSISRKDGKKIITQKEYVTHLGSVDVFKKFMIDASVKEGYGQIQKTVFLGDGAPWIWNMCDELYPDAVQILDHSHLKENVYGFSKYLHPNNEQKMTIWAEKIMEKLDKGNTDEVIDELPVMEDKKMPSGVVNLREYISKNKNRIKYPEFIEKGYLIGSGAVESGHKGVLQQRLKQPGMRWGKQGAQYIATLRAKKASGKWDTIKDYIAVAS